MIEQAWESDVVNGTCACALYVIVLMADLPWFSLYRESVEPHVLDYHAILVTSSTRQCMTIYLQSYFELH